MSTQEAKLQAIADAIREKDGTTEPIPANDFAARILAIETGSSFAVPLVVTADVGTTIAAVNGDTTITGTTGVNGNVTLILPSPGDWNITAQLGNKTKGPEIVSVQDGYTCKFSMESRLPEGYIEVKYITSSAVSNDMIIDTGVIFDWTKNIIFDLSFSIENPMPTTFKAFMYAFKMRDFGGTNKYRYGVEFGVNNGTCYLNYNSTSYNNQTFSKSTPISSGRHNVTFNLPSRTLLLDGTSFDLSLNAESPASAYQDTIKLMGEPSNNANYNYCLAGNLYSFRAFSENEIFHDFVPCISPDNVVGVYDLINGVFIQPNEAFTAGPSV